MAALLAEGKLQQQGVWIKQLLLHLLQGEGLGIGESGVAGGAGADGLAQLLGLLLELLTLLLELGEQGAITLIGEGIFPALVEGRTAVLQGLFLGQEGRLNALADVGAGLLEQFEQGAGPAAFAGVEGLGGMAKVGLAPIQLQQQINFERIKILL